MLLGCGAQSAPAQTAPGSATAAPTSLRAGARPVALGLVLSYEMQCGYPGPGPVTVRFPAREHVPPAIPASSVLVAGKPAPGVSVSGRTVTVTLAPPPPVMCDVIGPGRLTIEFTRAAGLGNPAQPGTYRIAATRGTASFSAPFTIRAG